MSDGLPFDGETYDPALDSDRLGRQLQAVFDVMKDGHWRTLDQIQREMRIVVQGTTASISARLRDFRKPKFGGHDVQRRGVPGIRGLYQYRLVVQTHADAHAAETVRES